MPTRRKSKNAVVGVFESRAQADRAMRDLRAAGFPDDSLGLVVRDERGQAKHLDADGEDTYAEEGAVAGAVAGAGAGALVGVGVLAGVIPVVGPVLAIGTLGTILLNAAGGAAIAGIAGALIGYGIPEDEAEFYESEVKAGRFLVTVEANGREAEARNILNRAGGYDRHGWTAVRSDRQNILETGGFRAEDGRTVQLREEHLRPRKETVSAGEVGIRKDVKTEHRTVTVPVEREEVVIERRPASGRAASGDLRNEEIRIPVKEERVTVGKEAVVREEVHVGKRKVQDSKTVSGDVRKEELVVESEGQARVRQNNRSNEKKR